MNAYRVALILCRAVVVALCWTAGLRFLALAITAVYAQFNSSGLVGVPLVELFAQPMINLVLLAVVAGFLQIFAASLATSMAGGAAFEGDAIASNRSLDATERALGRAGGGLFLLFFGAASAIPATFSGVYLLLFKGIGTGAGASYAIYSLVDSALPAIFQCVVGFALAFALGLRRLVTR